MPVKGFFCAIGNDSDMIEKKWLPEITGKYPNNTTIRYDASIDSIDNRVLTTTYYSDLLFSEGVTIIIRNADKKSTELVDFLDAFTRAPVKTNCVILVVDTCNKTTRIGKLIRDKFHCAEFELSEIKPFDLLDALNEKKLTKVLQFSRLLFNADYNPLAFFSLLVNHFIFLKKLRQVSHLGVSEISEKLGQHRFRVQKTLPACRFWTESSIDDALSKLARLEKNIRSWQFDEKMLIEMYLISICI